MSDKEFDTNELLSSLEKLKAKYSFNLEDDVQQDSPAEVEIKEEVIKAPETVDEAKISIPEVDAPQEDSQPAFENDKNDLSWIIDDESNQSAFIQAPVVVSEEDTAQADSNIHQDVIIKNEDKGTSWYLDNDAENLKVTEIPDVVSTSSYEEKSETETQFITQIEQNDETDDFADLDSEDDLKVIRADENRPSDSPFYAAFMESSNDASQAEKNQKPPKAVKTSKTKKSAKEGADKKISKKVVLNITVAIALAVAVWSCLFVTDLMLVKNDYAPLFCVEDEKGFDDGSEKYVGAFYQFKIGKNENGSVSKEFFPWFFE